MFTMIFLLMGLAALYMELDRQEIEDHKKTLKAHEEERNRLLEEAMEYANEIKTRAA